MRFISAFIVGFTLLIVGCERGSDSQTKSASQATQNASIKTSLDLKQVMGWIVDPNAATVFAAVGSNFTKDGEEKIAPKTDAQWNAVRNSAATVLESANLLVIAGRARDQDEWPKLVAGFGKAAEDVLKAIDVKDADELFTASGNLYEACTECHSKYIFGQPASTK